MGGRRGGSEEGRQSWKHNNLILNDNFLIEHCIAYKDNSQIYITYIELPPRLDTQIACFLVNINFVIIEMPDAIVNLQVIV